MKIEKLTADRFSLALPLFQAYQKFYGCEVPLERTAKHFLSLLESPERGAQFLALAENDRALGFATLYILPSTLSAGTSCVLNDLYVVPETRGQGVGRALLAQAAAHANELGYHELEWITALDNAAAQRLYDRCGAGTTLWRHYSLPLTAGKR